MTNLSLVQTLRFVSGVKAGQFVFVVPHISRKTGEMWGTQDSAEWTWKRRVPNLRSGCEEGTRLFVG